MPYSDVTRVLAIRHGETAWNRDARIQGQIDIPLNEAGLAQARSLAQALAEDALAAVYSSDLLRAHQTAEAVAAVQGLVVQADVGLRERHFGDFEGRTYHEIDADLPELAQRWRRRDPDFGPPGGEVLKAFFARSVSAIERIAASHRGQTIAVVCHGGVLDCLYRAATRLSLNAPRTWTVANASINRLLFTDDGCTLVGWGDTQHLDGSDHAPLDSRSAHAGHTAIGAAAAPLDEGSDGGRA
jgi:2,3-bisphosphoglycerate-dependent phosphoglycerate mutase